jgi:hypothetical protein
LGSPVLAAVAKRVPLLILAAKTNLPESFTNHFVAMTGDDV